MMAGFFVDFHRTNIFFVNFQLNLAFGGINRKSIEYFQIQKH